jgi:chromosomal replication initiation ATPase DnaA
MKAKEAVIYAQRRHGEDLNIEASDVAHTISGFMAGWTKAMSVAKTRHPTKTNIEKIITCVSSTLDVSVDTILSKQRHRDFVEARVVIACMCKDLLIKASLTSIGRHINRDHATILHYLKVLREYNTIKAKIVLCTDEYHDKT